ncbi:hypothetical protein HYALB_00004334 [Hymenoscyphus albidus]|uniref:RNA polymerase I-specific transcription initiation factor RRN3 n=1 Tax=Hymenoscyphus albidus TaxID=595503 RepID=A0A9N9Q2L6_9HELO|nr:hypothetical protein HYALB_00004334 [Hymenoscyphus albidus]
MVSLLSSIRAPAPATASKSPKPLIRPTTTGKRRKIEDIDFDDEIAADSNPPKKPRVTFNPDVEKREIVEYSAKGRSLDKIRTEVRRALESYAKGDNEGYTILRAVFSRRQENDDEDEDEQEDEDEVEQRLEIRSYVIALTGYASHLDKSCSTLVTDILHCEWMGRDEAFIKSYIKFLGSLASAQGAYVGKVLEMLVGYFAGIRFSSGRLPGHPDVKRDEMASRVHGALKYLLHLIPSASGIISPILSIRFPDPEDSKSLHVHFVRNLFRLMEYAPELKSDIFALVTEKIVNIDVKMQLRLEDEDEIATAVMKAITMSGKGTNETGDDGTDSDEDSLTSDDDDDLESDSRKIQQAQSQVEKMDAMLDILFTMYSPYFTDTHSHEAISTFEMLLTHFANIILPTYRSRHTQFLLFHFAQRGDHLVDQFCGTCVQLTFESSRPAVLRNSAASYLASFVSRGKQVAGHVVRTVFELIGNNLEITRIENELTCRGPDLRRYGTFYAMTQALLYIFCFRWRDLLVNETDEDDVDSFLNENLEWIPGVKNTLHNVIYSKLNPLKVCSPNIVDEFARIALHLKFMYVFPLLEANKRIRLSQFALGVGSGALRDVGGSSNDSYHQLETHFPFDPYYLPKSRVWVDDDYVEWQAIPGLDVEEDSDDESGEEEEEDIEVVDDDTATDDDK